MKKTDTIETLTALQAEHPDRAEELAIAIEALRAQRERFKAQVTEAEQMLGMVLGDASTPDRERTWHFLRDKLTLPTEVLDEVERRLGLAEEGGIR